ncbi:MFS transporter [Streptomyces sp. NPDC008150]|uniref:uridine transporter UriT n=1 Tax=Streptomyces sp. NPDC008150 TaxID=3364816 RepID=UPI0036EB63CD
MSAPGGPDTVSGGPGRAGRPARVGALMAALLVACFAFQLNASMLSPALADMATSLHTTSVSIGNTQTAFFTSAAVFSLFLPRLGDLIGRRKVLTGMLVLMVVGCVVSALAGDVPMLFVGRVLQGVSGPVVPLCLIMLRNEVCEPKTYGTLLGVITAVNGGIAGVDSVAGGSLTDHFGFGAVFWTMAAVAAIGAVLVATFTPESRAASGTTRMDWLGTVCLAVSVGTLLLALDEAGKLGAANWAYVAVMAVVAVVAFALFWRTEGRTAHPLVALHHLRRRATWSLLACTLLTMTGVFAIMNGLVPAFAQDGDAGLGMSATGSAWWTLTPYALAGFAMGPLAGRAAATWGYGRMLRFGLTGSIVAVAVLAATLHMDSRAWLLIGSLLVGITYAGVGNIILNGLGIVLSPDDNPGFLPGLNAGAFNLGAGVSFVILDAVQSAVHPSSSGSTAGYSTAMIAGMILIAVALAVSFLIPKPTKAEVAG